MRKKFQTYSRKALCRGYKHFSEDLAGVELLKEEVELNKPIYIGQAVLDLSKLIMYKLRYRHLPKYATRFGGTIKIAGGDTDSFFLQLQNISLQQLLPAMSADGLLDTSNFPPSHPLFSNAYKAKLGCIKDEAAGEVWREWVFLRPKCYSMITLEGKEHKRAKGIQRSVVGKEIRHAHYLSVVESG